MSEKSVDQVVRVRKMLIALEEEIHPTAVETYKLTRTGLRRQM
ncbi:MAG: hypothetical protein Q7O66_02305 [Dehalococcoidia bacterium]|nr:hypothetical protein [Dehalococcoidia bacterium]